MNWNVIEGNWKQLKGRAKEDLGKLLDDCPTIDAGMRDQLAGRFQVTYGLAEDQAVLQVKALEETRKGMPLKRSK